MVLKGSSLCVRSQPGSEQKCTRFKAQPQKTQLELYFCEGKTLLWFPQEVSLALG